MIAGSDNRKTQGTMALGIGGYRVSNDVAGKLSDDKFLSLLCGMPGFGGLSPRVTMLDSNFDALI